MTISPLQLRQAQTLRVKPLYCVAKFLWKTLYRPHNDKGTALPVPTDILPNRGKGSTSRFLEHLKTSSESFIEASYNLYQRNSDKTIQRWIGEPSQNGIVYRAQKDIGYLIWLSCIAHEMLYIAPKSRLIKHLYGLEAARDFVLRYEEEQSNASEEVEDSQAAENERADEIAIQAGKTSEEKLRQIAGEEAVQNRQRANQRKIDEANQ